MAGAFNPRGIFLWEATKMIRKLDDGWCWIATDDEPSNAVVWETCVRGGFTAYSDVPNGCEDTEERAEKNLSLARDARE